VGSWGFKKFSESPQYLEYLINKKPRGGGNRSSIKRKATSAKQQDACQRSVRLANVRLASVEKQSVRIPEDAK